MKLQEVDQGFVMKSKDGQEIFVYCWDEVTDPIGVVQIIHGMAEHGKRYTEFAHFLNKKGYIVYGDDHRGHGQTAKTKENLGYIGEDGFERILEDEKMISQIIKDKYKGLPLFLFGHSFGSFISQSYIINYGSDINGAILMGSAARSKVEVKGATILAGLEKRFKGDRHPSKLLDTLSFSSFNKKIPNPTHKFQWLSTDMDEVNKYEADPLCGSLFTTGFFYYFYKGLTSLWLPQNLDKIRKDFPVFILSGEEDPVGGYGKNVIQLVKTYENHGLVDVNHKLYKDKRHELLNETNKLEVFNDILAWLNSKVTI